MVYRILRVWKGDGYTNDAQIFAILCDLVDLKKYLINFVNFDKCIKTGTMDW
jgi:hypothetical protein